MGELQLDTFEWVALALTLVSAAIGIAYAFGLRRQILAAPDGTPKMQEVALSIQEGASAYLSRQFRTIVWLVIILGVVLLISGREQGRWNAAIGIGRGIAFLAGCLASGLTGFVGMWVAVRSNVRTADASRRSLAEALTLAFRGGTVTGMFTVGLGLVGATIIFLIYKERAEEVLLGFGFGGCLLALFMRVGGGIYTKAADVGADLVGKVEAGIPEDDPRNAAVIADNVGDNVGDCAGMAADIFESYEVTLVAAMILALAAGKPEWVVFALVVRGIGVLTSIVGTYLVKMRSETEHAMAGITRGFVWSALLSIVGFAIFAWVYLLQSKGDSEWWRLLLSTTAGIFLAVLIYKLTEYYTSVKRAPVQEIAEATQTGTATNILTGFAFGMESSVAAILMICGAVICGVLIFWGHSVTDILFSVSLTGLGMLTTTGIIVSMDSYGPIADNANGIGEMANLEPDARKRMDELDAVGNTTKAATKGFAIASAVIAAVSLFGSYMDKVVQSFETPAQVAFAFEKTGISQELLGYEATVPAGEYLELVPGTRDAQTGRDLTTAAVPVGGRVQPEQAIMRYWLDRKKSLQEQLTGARPKEDAVPQGQPEPETGQPAPQPVLQLMRERGRALEALKPPINAAVPEVFVGLLIGGAMPFLFSSLLIRAVGRAAFAIINEVRRQFREIVGLWEGKARPDSARCVDICTSAAIRELVGPGVLAILTPVAVGCFLGWPGLGGYLSGIIVSGQLLAVLLANSGGAWDNAKKFIEDGAFGGTGSEAHKAAVVSDTVGDPFKDTAGPALNPLIKVMNLTGVLVAPLVVGWYGAPGGWVVGTVCLVIMLTAFTLSRRGKLEKGLGVQASLDSGEES